MTLPQMDNQAIYNKFAFNSHRARDDRTLGSGDTPVTATDGSTTQQCGRPGRRRFPSLLLPLGQKNNRNHFIRREPGETGTNWARGNVACNGGAAYWGHQTGNNGDAIWQWSNSGPSGPSRGFAG